MEENPRSGNDETVLERINRLVSEEHELYARREPSDRDRLQLQEIKIELDQCWDLLRQRQALREFDRNPDKAKVRAPEIVENYEG